MTKHTKQILVAIGFLFVAIILGGWWAYGQESAKLPEASKNHLLAVYEKAMLAQQEAQADANMFTQAAMEEIKANHLPDGTRFDVRVATQEVLVITPPPKEPAKPAEKKP